MKYVELSKKLKIAIQDISPNALKVLSSPLLEDINREGLPDGDADRLLTPEEMAALEDKVFSDLREFDQVKKLPYHNVIHTRAVLDRIRQLKANARLSRSDGQILEIAALFHDYEHGNHRPARNGRLSNEERSAIRADQWAKATGLSIRQRLKLYGLIIGTTFFDPIIHPITRLEKMLVMADLGGFTEASDEWLRQSVHVTEERAEDQRAASVVGWLYEQDRFLDYVEEHMTGEARKLAWDDHFREKRRLVRDLILDEQKRQQAYPAIFGRLRRLLPNAV